MMSKDDLIIGNIDLSHILLAVRLSIEDFVKIVNL